MRAVTTYSSLLPSLQVRCFFEEGAFDKDGNMVVDKSVSINKIGHGL